MALFSLVSPSLFLSINRIVMKSKTHLLIQKLHHWMHKLQFRLIALYPAMGYNPFPIYCPWLQVVDQRDLLQYHWLKRHTRTSKILYFHCPPVHSVSVFVYSICSIYLLACPTQVSWKLWSWTCMATGGSLVTAAHRRLVFPRPSQCRKGHRPTSQTCAGPIFRHLGRVLPGVLDRALQTAFYSASMSFCRNARCCASMEVCRISSAFCCFRDFVSFLNCARLIVTFAGCINYNLSL